MEQLCNATLDALGGDIATPGYDRTALRPGILHLGLGAFHRAHQAVYTDAALRASGGDWGIIGVCMRGDSVARQLRPQDLLYSVWSRDAGEDSLRVIGALAGVIVAPEEPDVLDAAFADPAIRIVTLTVTEKGYCLDGDDLDVALPAIRADLAEPQLARTAIGVLARGLARRCDSGGAPLTVISCDNLAENGARLSRALRSYAARAFPHLLEWLDHSVRFPCSMVDRIVPAMDATARERQAQRLGLWDEAAVATEPFNQWIIEDDFAAGAPDWAGAGARLVADIRPFEAIKLRLLNAAHSAIAYCGLLAGLETVADVMADARLRDYIERLMSGELAPALTAPAGFDLDVYRDQLLQRFANPYLHHRCAQIAMDGTEKIRQRWLPTLSALPADSLLLRALAVWSHYVLCTDLALEDPRRAALAQLRDSGAPLASRLPRLLACLGLPGTDDPARLASLLRHCEALARGGLEALLVSPGLPHEE